jgi:hypothetical protein
MFGVAGITGERRPASIIYAWSRSGLREAAVAALSEYVSDNDGWMIEVARALLNRSRAKRGSRTSTHLDGLASIFDDIPSVLERLQTKPDSGDTLAVQVTRAVTSAIEVQNGTVEGWIAHKQDRRSTSRCRPTRLHSTSRANIRRRAQQRTGLPSEQEEISL